jgi:hypothetical protein
MLCINNYKLSLGWGATRYNAWTGHGEATWPDRQPVDADGTRPPSPSPHSLNTLVATHSTILAASLPHELEALQHENSHGAVQVASPVTSSPQIWHPYNRAQEHSSSFVSQHSPSPTIATSSSPSLESSAFDLTDPSALCFRPQGTDSSHHAPSER